MCAEFGAKRGIHKEWKVNVTLIFKSEGGAGGWSRRQHGYSVSGKFFTSENLYHSYCNFSCLLTFYLPYVFISIVTKSDYHFLIFSNCVVLPIHKSNWAPFPFRPPWFACINLQQVGIFAFKRSATVFGRNNAHCNILALSSALFRMWTLQIFTAVYTMHRMLLIRYEY